MPLNKSLCGSPGICQVSGVSPNFLITGKYTTSCPTQSDSLVPELVFIDETKAEKVHVGLEENASI